MKGLEGIKVIDFSQYVAAPACPRILGEMGASVIKVEPTTGDEQRTNGPGFGLRPSEIENRGYDMANMNKDWVSINLKNPEGVEFMHKLLADVDIFVTSLRSGALNRLGLDYDSLHKKYPKLIWAQMRGFGERGPMKDAKGFDTTSYSARGGYALNCPQKGDAPANMPIAIGDWNAAMAMASGVLAALVRRLISGEGDRVSVNLYHVALWGMHVPIIARQDGVEYPRSRKRITCPTNNSYQSSDGVWFFICFGHYDKYHELVFKTCGAENLLTDPEVSSLEIINANGKYVYVVEELEKAFSKKTWAEWEKLFLEFDIPHSKCFSVDDILADEEAYENDGLRKINYDEFGVKAQPTAPVRLWSVGDPELWIAKPVGYDTRKYMKQYGYSDAQIEEMAQKGAVKLWGGPELRFDKPVRTSAKIPLSDV